MNRIIRKIDKITKALIHIIKTARREIVLVSPFLQFEFSKTKRWTEFLKAIQGAIDRDVDVTFIARERDEHTRKDGMKTLKEFRDVGCSVYLVEKLHAKFYYSESMVMVTSMNLWMGSTVANHEIAMITVEPDEIRETKDYINDLKKLYTRRSVYGGRVERKEKLPDGMTKTWFKVTTIGTKYAHIRLEGKWSKKVNLDDITPDVTLEKGKSYECMANLIWRNVNGKNKQYVTRIILIKF